MESSRKVALELVLGWLEDAKPAGEILEADLTNGLPSEHVFRKDAREHLRSIAALQTTCKLESPVKKTYSLACWSTLLNAYADKVTGALPEHNCDRDWGDSELKRIRTLKRKGPGAAGPSFQKAISTYPTEASQIFVLGGGVTGAWQHINIMDLVHKAQDGRISTFHPILSMGLEIECDRVNAVKKLLKLCPGLRSHGAARRLVEGDFLALWEAALPHYWADLLRRRLACPRPFEDFLHRDIRGS